MRLLSEYQDAVFVWCVETYGEQSLMERGLCIGEEAGEVQRAILKAHQKIRPSTRGNLREELADLLIATLATAGFAEIDLESALEERFLEIQQRPIEREG